MLQQAEPDDYVVATGETHSVEEFVERAFFSAGLDYRKYVRIDPSLYRPAEVELLVGDSSKAAAQLGWRSRTSFRELVQEMVNHDCGSQVLSADKAREAAAQDKWSCGGPPRPEPFSSRPGNHAPHFTRL